MICRNYQEGQKLDVAGLNEITVIIDRSETERTEVALNSWWAGLDGPPHKHEQKEQIFFVLQGRGTVKIGGEVFEAKPGDLFYVPANVIHQTINQGKEPLQYLLFNAFLKPDKEGHATFAEHVRLVKETRRLQAQTQQANAGSNEPQVSSQAKGKRISGNDFTQPTEISQATLLPRGETKGCEAILINSAPDTQTALEISDEVERTLFVIAGGGIINVGNEATSVGRGNVVYVPRKHACVARASSERLKCLSLNTVVGK